MCQSRATVIVVDDDPDVCDSLEAVVTAMGHVCLTFASPSALLADWDALACDFLILDIDMHPMNGVEFLTILQHTGHCPPTLFFTGRPDAAAKAAAAAFGHIPVLQKGAASAVLTDYLRSWLSTRKTGELP